MELATLFENAFASPAAGVKESFRVVLDLLRKQQQSIEDLSDEVKRLQKNDDEECSLLVENLNGLDQLEEQPSEIKTVSWPGCNVVLRVLKFKNKAARLKAEKKLESCATLDDDESPVLLVRHVPNRGTRRDVLKLIQILEAEDEPSELNKYAMCTVRFPSRVNATAALSILDGLELDGCRLEATLLNTSYLPRELEDLESQLASNSVMLTSVPSSATPQDLLELFREDDVVSCHLTPCRAAHGDFSIGSLTFRDGTSATQAAVNLSRGKLRLSLRDGEWCVGALAVQEPAIEGVRRRVDDLEKTLSALEISHDRLTQELRAAREDQDSRKDALDADLDALRERLQLVWNTQATDGSDLRKLISESSSKYERLRDTVTLLEKEQKNAAESSADYVFSELEKLDILARENGRFVASNSLFPSSKQDNDLESRVSEALSECVTKKQLGRACGLAASAHGDDESSFGLTALAQKIRAEITAENATTTTTMEDLLEKLKDEFGAEQRVLSKQLESVTSTVEGLAEDQEKTLQGILESRKSIDFRLGAFEIGARARDAVLAVQLDESHLGLSRFTERLSQEKVDETKLDSRLLELSERLESQIFAVRSSPDKDDGIESLRRKIASKVDKEEVLRLLATTIKPESTRRPSSDALMIGALKYKCLGCNRLMSKMHDRHADKVVHAGLSPIPSTHSNKPSTAGPESSLRPLRLHREPSVPRPKPLTC